MKIALSVWKDRISPVFDSANQILIVDVSNGSVENTHHESLHSDLPFYRAARLSSIGIKVLICGAISQALEDMVKSYGILVIPLISGNVDEVLQAYLTNALSSPNFRLPGWRKKFIASSIMDK